MKTRPLKGYYGSVGCEVYDIDLATACDEEIMELGYLVEDQLIVFIDKESCNGIDHNRHHEIQTQWGQVSMPLVYRLIKDRVLDGAHWSDTIEALCSVTRGLNLSNDAGVARVSYRRDDAGNSLGLFSDGELQWHADQVGVIVNPIVVGLHSVAGSVGSRTDFLQTFDMWDKLSADMQSTLKELKIVHKWQNSHGNPYGDASQQIMSRYSGVPVALQETPLYNETASGRPGIRFPSYSFNKFANMSEVESWKLYAELSRLVYDPAFTYQHPWKDGQVMYFDQAISLHRRPTNKEDSPNREMIRTITYMDKLYPNSAPADYVYIDGKKMQHAEYAKLIDTQRLAEYNKEQGIK